MLTVSIRHPRLTMHSLAPVGLHYRVGNKFLRTRVYRYIYVSVQCSTILDMLHVVFGGGLVYIYLISGFPGTTNIPIFSAFLF